MNKGFTVWFTGLSGAGKSTLSQLLGKKLKEFGRNAEILDKDLVSANLCQDLGLTKDDRDICIQRIAFVCKLLTRNGVAVLSPAISPYRKARETARNEIVHFVEVYVKCPREVCVERAVKGLSGRALKDNVKEFAGISDPYEEPLNPDVVVETDKETIEESANKIVQKLIELGYISQTGSAGHVYSPEEEDKIKERLSRLGYL